jgi:hypothetical protein
MALFPAGPVVMTELNYLPAASMKHVCLLACLLLLPRPAMVELVQIDGKSC